MVKKEFNGWINQLYHTNILDLCNDLGIELTQDGRTYRGKDHDSLVITPSKNSFYWNSRQVGGTGGLAFLKRYYFADEQLSQKDLYNKLHKISAENNLVEFDKSQISEKATIPYVYPQENVVDNIEQAKNYLSNERKIAPQFVDWLHKHGYLDQDKMDNAVFKEINPLTGEIIGATKQGTHIDFDKYPKRGTLKEIDKNSTHNAAWFFDIGKPENLRFFESPIDAMSFYQLAPDKFKNTRFISMNGLKERVASGYMTLTDSQLAKTGSGIKTIAFGVDNDEAGDSFIKNMQQYRFTNNQGENIKLVSAQPNKKWGKDWNDELKGVAALKEQQRKRTPYEDENGIVSDTQIKKYLKDEELSLTENPNEAIYLMRDGSMISGNFEDGIRGEDHRCIEGLISESDDMYKSDKGRENFWSALQTKTEMIMLVPESHDALKATEQHITTQQKKVLDTLDYPVHNYNHLITLTGTEVKNDIPKQMFEKNSTSTKEPKQNKPVAKAPSSIAKTPITNLMQDVQSYLADPNKVLELTDFLGKFHNYSIRNRLLIAKQREGALAVGSYKKFKELGYSVKKGEKGIKILTPIQVKKFNRNGRLVSEKFATKAEKTKIKAGEIKLTKKLEFMQGNVFDVTQTTMPKEKYPEMYPNRHQDFDINKATDQKKIDHGLDKFADSIGFKVKRDLPEEVYSQQFGTAKGVTLPQQKVIYLNPDNTPTEKTTTLMHELGHAQLHDEKSKASRPIKELQAQLTSYLVAKSYGIDNHDYTVDYISSWTDNGKALNQLNVKEQAAILNNSTKAADKMVDFIDGRDKTQSLTSSKTKTMKPSFKKQIKQTKTKSQKQETTSQSELAAQFVQQQQVKQHGGLELS